MSVPCMSPDFVPDESRNGEGRDFKLEGDQVMLTNMDQQQAQQQSMMPQPQFQSANMNGAQMMLPQTSNQQQMMSSVSFLQQLNDLSSPTSTNGQGMLSPNASVPNLHQMQNVDVYNLGMTNEQQPQTFSHFQSDDGDISRQPFMMDIQEPQQPQHLEQMNVVVPQQDHYNFQQNQNQNYEQQNQQQQFAQQPSSTTEASSSSLAMPGRKGKKRKGK